MKVACRLINKSKNLGRRLPFLLFDVDGRALRKGDAVGLIEGFLVGAKKVSSSKPKAGNKNQKPFERILNMEYELVGIGTVKMTVGVRRSTHEKVQYCITAIDNKE